MFVGTQRSAAVAYGLFRFCPPRGPVHRGPQRVLALVARRASLVCRRKPLGHSHACIAYLRPSAAAGKAVTPACVSVHTICKQRVYACWGSVFILKLFCTCFSLGSAADAVNWERLAAVSGQRTTKHRSYWSPPRRPVVGRASGYSEAATTSCGRPRLYTGADVCLPYLQTDKHRTSVGHTCSSTKEPWLWVRRQPGSVQVRQTRHGENEIAVHGSFVAGLVS